MKVTKPRGRFLKILLIILVIICIVSIVIIGWPYILQLFKDQTNSTSPQPDLISNALSTINENKEVETAQTDVIPSSNDFPFIEQINKEGIIVLSMGDGIHNSLYLFHPQYLTYKRITNPNTDDIDPAISPDGNQIAFSSRRNGYWDIYLLNMADASLSRITDSPEYEGHPSWSPDGKWLVYEKYQNNNFDIYIQALDQLEEQPINLTQSEFNEFSPKWSPNGRILAYLSDEAGSSDVWMADLNNTENRFTNLTNSDSIEEKNPVWNAAGNKIAWSATRNSYTAIYQYDVETSKTGTAGESGDLFVWSPDDSTLLSIQELPNGSSVNFYQKNGKSVFPSQYLQQSVEGMDWGGEAFVNNVIHYPFAEYSDTASTVLWSPEIDTYPLPPNGRYAVVPLTDVSAPYAYLHDLADESFDELRKSIARKSGWDVLNSLENAFIPITVPTEIWNTDNWFYTGRAIAINSSPIGAGWMVLEKEEINGKIYWRVFVKCRYQDGSQGLPLKIRGFNLDARSEGNPEIYDQGGAATEIPKGYWIDFTDIASRYGWERISAMTQWETYYSSARFNIFIFRQDMDWSQAMLEIIPIELIPTQIYAESSKEHPVILSTESSAESTGTSIPQTIRPTWTPVPEFDQP
jgi:TolB protein